MPYWPYAVASSASVDELPMACLSVPYRSLTWAWTPGSTRARSGSVTGCTFRRADDEQPIATTISHEDTKARSMDLLLTSLVLRRASSIGRWVLQKTPRLARLAT